MTRALRLSLAGLVLVLVLGGGFVCQRVADRGRFASVYSSYGAGPQGTRALYLLADALGGRPARWVEDLAALPASGGMLVALGECKSGMARPLSRYEQRELELWIEAGGVLLVAGARHYLPKGLGVAFEPSPECAERAPLIVADGSEDGDEAKEQPATDPAAMADSGSGEQALPEGAVWTSPADELLHGLPPIAMRQPGRLVVDDDGAARVLLTLPDAPDMPDSEVQREAGVVVSRGRGHVIVLASASMLQNRELAPSEGGVLFGRLLAAYAPAGPVLFDEYHLGVGERRSMMRYLRQAGATPFALQLLLVGLLLLWRSGARFGAVRGERPAPPAGTASFVSALGGLFERAGDPRGALRMLEHQALAHVAARHHLPVSSASRLARALQERGLPQAAAAVRRINETEHVIMVEKLDLVAASKRIDDAVAQACALLPAAGSATRRGPLPDGKPAA